MPPLSPYFARKNLAGLNLKDNIRQHVERLLDLAGPDHRVQVSNIHESLFPLSTPGSANAALNRLLRTLNEATAAQGVPLRAEITADKKAGAANRWVWIEGPEPGPALAYTGELNAIPPGQLVTDQRGLPAGDLPTVVLVTFNEHETAAVIRRFHPQGQPQSETRNGMTYSLLGSHGGMCVVHRVSKQGEGEAQNAAHDAVRDWAPRAILGVGITFGVNPAKQRIGDVLISESVRGYELGRLNADGTFTLRSDKPPASPVLYQRFNHLDQTIKTDAVASLHWPTLRFGTLLSGNKLVDNLDYRASLLRLESEAIGGEMEAVGIQLAADRHRIDWIIVKAICDWGDGNKNAKTKEADQRLAATNAALAVHAALSLGSLYADGPPSPPAGNLPTARSTNRHPSETRAQPPAARLMGLTDHAAIRCDLLIPDGQGRLASLDKDVAHEAKPERETEAERGVHALDYLLAWVDSPEAPPLFTLLGEYGMGKTVTCQRLAETLDRRHREDPTHPVPLYFDLRHVTGLDRRVPTLKETLEECMARGWLGEGPSEGYLAENVHRWIAQGAVVIFDGLDEVLVKLKESDGQVFTKGLLRLIALTRARRRADGLGQRLKILISCRTQYFRTLRDQQNHFTGQERGEHRADAFRALVLLPLSEDQVRRYLGAALPDTDPERVLDTIRSVHNLSELAQRPYTLRLVSDFIPEIERDRMAGRTVYGVTLYRRMAQRWLERDSGKHHIRPEHKLQLAAHLAAHLWKTGNGLLPADGIERWFHAWLEAEPDLRRRYANLHPDQLEEDLRTATFLTRQDDKDGSSFRFAHTSLLEFFLADYLLRAIREDVPERWAMERPSMETLDFLGQLLAETGDPALVRTLQSWRTPYRPGTSELMLAYTLRVHAKGWPAPLLKGIALNDARLDDWVFRTEEGKMPLDLGNADFRGASLRRTIFERVHLGGASFEAAQLAQANFLDCDARGTAWGGAECTATIWRQTRLDASLWNGLQGYRAQFLNCGVPLIEWGEDVHSGIADLQIAPRHFRDIESTHSHSTRFPEDFKPLLQLLTGHVGPVVTCAICVDGVRLLSAGFDGTLRLWDAHSGEMLMTLLGHKGRINSCTFSPNGTVLLSCGEDCTLRLWDARNGDSLMTLKGHESSVYACSFSPDGTSLISAGFDGTLRLWDSSTGDALFILTGHVGAVKACTFSPDGTRLLSAGVDKTLRVWDIGTRDTLLNLLGHADEVWSCSFSPDGSRLLSSGKDGTLRLWDARNGDALQELRADARSVWTSSFSPDGSCLISSGWDGVIRLWDARSGEAVKQLSADAWMSCIFAPDGNDLLYGKPDGSLRIWDIRKDESFRTMAKYNNIVRTCAFSPDGTLLFSAGDDGKLRLWDTQTGEAKRVFPPNDRLILDFALSPDGARLLTVGSGKTIYLWNMLTGEIQHIFEEPEGMVNACAFSPDGSRLLTTGDCGVLRLWDANTAESIQILKSDCSRASRACAFSPDGTRALSLGGDGTLGLWDVDSGEELLRISAHKSAAWACAYAPDSTRLLSAGWDGTVRLWDASNGEALLVLSGHFGPVWRCIFSPDGTRLLSAGDDGTLRIWDAARGDAIITLTGHAGAIWSCAFSPDGARLLSAGFDGTLRLWDAQSGELLRIHAISNRGDEGHAVWDPRDNRLIEACGDAWRWLAWVRPGHDGWPERLPLETFGPIPEPRRLEQASRERRL